MNSNPVECVPPTLKREVLKTVVSRQKLGIAAAFKIYDAKLTSSRWAVSAIAHDGALVVSCSEAHFHKGMRYVDALSRWGDDNPTGRDLMRRHLDQAQREDKIVRLVIAHGAQSGVRAAEYFHVRPDLVGRVTAFDGDSFTIEFNKA
jgi:hypothetical protein